MVVVTSSFYENFKMAFDTLRSNKLRSFLTIIGVVIGVITVMLISSLISGIKVAVEKQVESFGTTSIFLYKMDIGIRTSSPTREERRVEFRAHEMGMGFPNCPRNLRLFFSGRRPCVSRSNPCNTPVGLPGA